MFHKNLIFYVVQGVTLCLLCWSIQVLMPVIVATLYQGMAQWNTATKIYCWVIQIILLRISFSLRAYVFVWAEHRVINAPSVIRYVIMGASYCVVLFGLYLIIAKMGLFGCWMLGESLLLLLQVYYLVGMAAPMGRCFNFAALRST